MNVFVLALLAIGQLVRTVDPTIVDPSEWSHYEVTRAPSCISIDGVVSDKEWGKAPAMAGFADVFQPERKPLHPTTAKMMWDDQYLYVMFDCEDDDIRGTHEKFDDPVYSQEAVEVFIDPEGKGRHYWEVDVSPRNVVVDLMVTGANWVGFAGTLMKYNVKGLLTATQVRGTVNDPNDKDEGWTLEMAIPWSDFGGRKVNVPPKDGDSWRVNLFRIDMLSDVRANDQFMSWSRSPGVFHQPRNFGVIVFRR